MASARLAALIVTSLLVSACGASSPASPAPTPTIPVVPAPAPPAPPVVAASTTSGHVVDAATSAAVSGVMPLSLVDSVPMTTTASDAGGAFTISTTAMRTDPLYVSFTSRDFYTRNTFVKIPGGDVTVPVIRTSFNLDAFNQMFRTNLSMLMRWTSAPPLVLKSQVMQFTNVNASSFAAIGETLSAGELASWTSDLSYGLPLMTGGTFNNFAGINTEAASTGSTVTMMVSGQITVGRLAGLKALSGGTFDGYSRWQFDSTGRITAGLLMLDRDYDRNASSGRRGLRIHELGHTLGYNHVTNGQVSVMNPTVVTEPNAFDIASSKIAFQRPIGNRSPDTDPSGFSTNVLVVRWSDPIR